MSIRVSIYLHHHGDFTPLSFNGSAGYVGGTVEIIPDVDPDLITIFDLTDYAVKYKYLKTDFLYFLADGHSFKKGIRLLFDDDSVRTMINLSLPYKKIKIYVDHKKRFQTNDPPPPKNVNLIDKDDDMGGTVDDDIGNNIEEEDEALNELVDGGESEDSDDPNYEAEEMIESETDEELATARKERISRGDNSSDSEYAESDYNSDELRTDESSSEDENLKKGYVGIPPGNKKKKKVKFYNEKYSDNLKWEVGLKFANMEEFRQAVREYGIKERRAVHFITNDKDRVQVGCEKGCRFYLWCSRLQNEEAVQIKTCLDDHLCTKPYQNKLVTVKYLESVYGERIRSNPQWKVKDMQQTIKEDLEIEVPTIKCSRLRKAALEGVLASLKDHYARVWDFGYEILKNNPKNRVEIMTSRITEDSVNKFKRIYICYHATKEGWTKGCRPILGLDGCFLKTVSCGQLLSAVGRDGNNMMFPVAYAVVETENTDSWRWFLDFLKGDLNLGDGTGLTVISDQQKGLKKAMKELLPHVEHRLCTRHLYANFKKKFGQGPVKKAFWMAACATYPAAFHRAMKALERYSKAAHEQVKDLDLKSWSKAFFQTHCFADNVENNMSGCFKSWIVNERFMPLLTMLQEIHFKLMRRMRVNRESMLSSDSPICPKAMIKLNAAIKRSRKWHATWDGLSKYMVKMGTRSVTVELDSRKCDCRAWDLTGIPCEHAVAAIHDRRHQPVSYVSEYYSKDMYLKAYNLSLEALRGEEFWETHDTAEIYPPDVPKKLRGRPKRLRRREDWEGGNQSKKPTTAIPGLQRLTQGKIMHCSNCRQTGHRRPKCPSLQEGYDPTQEDHNTASTEDQGAQEKQPSPEHQDGVRSRAKLPVRRAKLPGIVIREPTEPCQPSQPTQGSTTDKGKAKMVETRKGKAKILDTTERQQKVRPYWMVNKRAKGIGLSRASKEVDTQPPAGNMDVQTETPSKSAARTTKITTLAGKKNAEEEDLETFKKNLIGLGFAKLFMPTPGFNGGDHQPNGTPSADTPPKCKAADGSQTNQQLFEKEDTGQVFDEEETESEEDQPQPRRSNRLWMKTKFNWTNTPDDPVDLS